MNRLIVIGNGFDIAHGLKTSYHDFILYYLKYNCIKALEEDIKSTNNQPYKSVYHHRNNLLEVTIDVHYDKYELAQALVKISEIKDFVDFAGKRCISFNYFFKLLEIGIHKLSLIHISEPTRPCH
jgi:hypothetical protein